MIATVMNTPHCTISVKISGIIRLRNVNSTTRTIAAAVISVIIRYSRSKASSISLTITEFPIR